ncbi:MAG: DUF1080 domain-containing protein [Bacteroidota bacterium]
MKKQITCALIAVLFGLNAQTFAQNKPADPYLGMWALTLDYEDNSAGWLEVTRGDGFLDASLLWRWGSVYPIDFTFVMDKQLYLTHGRDMVKDRDEEGNPSRTIHPLYWMQVNKTGHDAIEGIYFSPKTNGEELEMVSFTGKRIPPAGEAPDLKKIKYGKPIQLFNGKDLEEWELLNQNAANGWKVEDGIMINDPVQKPGESHISYGNLRTIATYEDFNLKVEVNVPAGSNGGIYLRGIYEVQVLDSYGKELDPHNMGALYSRITPLEAAEKPAGEWQEMDITLCKRHLTVILNGRKIIDNQPVKGVTGGALTSDEFSPGPIYLQGDHGKVSYRKLELIPIL